MNFKIRTRDYRTHDYSSKLIPSVIDLLLALEDFDTIDLSGITYPREAILHVEESKRTFDT